MSKLRKYRTDHGLSQTDFGKSVGVKKATISRIEKGKRSPSLALVSRIVEVAKGELSADDFMPAPPTPTPDTSITGRG